MPFLFFFFFLIFKLYIIVLVLPNIKMPFPFDLKSFYWKLSWEPCGGSFVWGTVFLILLLEFSAFHIFHFNYTMPWCRYLWVHLFWDLCSSYNWISVFLQVHKVVKHNFMPSETLIMWTLVDLMLSQRSFKLFSYFLIYFFLFAILITCFPLFFLPDGLCVLLYPLICC